MEANEISLFNEVTSEESATVTGGASTVNFDLNSYLFTIGAGAVFDGGVTTNVVDIAFKQALYTTSGGGSTGSGSTGGSTGISFPWAPSSAG